MAVGIPITKGNERIRLPPSLGNRGKYTPRKKRRRTNCKRRRRGKEQNLPRQKRRWSTQIGPWHTKELRIQSLKIERMLNSALDVASTGTHGPNAIGQSKSPR